MNTYVSEALVELKSNTAVMTMLKNEVIEIRCELYKDLDDPNDMIAREVFDNIDEAIKYVKLAEHETAVFIDGIETINVLDL